MTGVEPLMLKIHNEIRRVDTEILAAVRQQVRSLPFDDLLASLRLKLKCGMGKSTCTLVKVELKDLM